MSNHLTKVCTNCKKELYVENFYKNKRSKDGLMCHCKVCLKNYYEENKERIILKVQEYKLKNRSKILGYKRNWDKKNRDYNRDRLKKYRENNKEKWILYRMNTDKKKTGAREKKQREECSDNYIKRLISDGMKIPFNAINQETIRVKRLNVLSNRFIKKNDSKAAELLFGKYKKQYQYKRRKK